MGGPALSGVGGSPALLAGSAAGPAAAEPGTWRRGPADGRRAPAGCPAPLGDGVGLLRAAAVRRARTLPTGGNPTAPHTLLTVTVERCWRSPACPDPLPAPPRHPPPHPASLRPSEPRRGTGVSLRAAIVPRPTPGACQGRGPASSRCAWPWQPAVPGVRLHQAAAAPRPLSRPGTWLQPSRTSGAGSAAFLAYPVPSLGPPSATAPGTAPRRPAGPRSAGPLLPARGGGRTGSPGRCPRSRCLDAASRPAPQHV